MAEYLVMTLEDEHAHASQSPKAMSELIEKSATYADELRRAGRLKDRGRLRPSKEGKRVRREGARLEVRDGPFAEEGKALGGYYWVQASSLDEATELAAQAPVLPTDEIDVRPLMKGIVPDGQGGEAGQDLRVRGAREHQDGRGLDRGDGPDRPGDPRWLHGNAVPRGLRLEPPKRGQRIATRGERRATFDGPFLESKEVIGGLFLMRMTSIEDAVRWAAQTPFVVHGALEIRELWRT